MTHSERVEDRPKLLFLSQVLPYPPDGGVKIRTFHVLRILAGAFDVTALCFYRWKGGKLHSDLERDLDALGEFASVEAFPIPQEHAKWRLPWDHARSLLSGRPYTVFTYQSHPFRRRLVELLHGSRFDLVHADSIDLSTYFPLVARTPLVCVHHDAQSRLLRRRAEQESSGWRRRYVGHQANLMAAEERRWCPRVALNVTVSEVDRDVLSQGTGGGSYAVVPNGVDVDGFQPSSQEPDLRRIVFVGGTTWFPNLDALRYFSEEILPLLRQREDGILATWVGRASNEEVDRYGANGDLHLTGYVEDIRPHVDKAGCYVVPLRVGGGTRIKILDAWAMGKAVVSTSIGCEGLDAVDGENILVRDAPEDFAQAVDAVLRDRQLRTRLERNARTTVVRRYGWNVIGQEMIARYEEILTPAS